MQIGLVLKPGPQEPWTPYRMIAAFIAGRHSGRGDLDLSRRRRRGRGGAGALPAEHDLRRHGDGRALQGQPARAGARPRLQQDPARRRRGRQLGKVPRPDGREHLHQQRPRLHQLLGRLGLAAHEGNRPGARREARPDRSQAARRPEGRPGRVHRARHGAAASGRRSKPT